MSSFRNGGLAIGLCGGGAIGLGSFIAGTPLPGIIGVLLKSDTPGIVTGLPILSSIIGLSSIRIL